MRSSTGLSKRETFSPWGSVGVYLIQRALRGRFASSSDRWAPGVWKYFWIPSQELMDPANVWEPPQWELFSYMLTYPINIVQSPDRS